MQKARNGVGGRGKVSTFIVTSRYNNFKGQGDVPPSVSYTNILIVDILK